jgi:iron complex outermembrane receptor protein
MNVRSPILPTLLGMSTVVVALQTWGASDAPPEPGVNASLSAPQPDQAATEQTDRGTTGELRIAQSTQSQSQQPSNSSRSVSASESPSDLQEVVVTAERIKERLQDVPISITALAGDALEAQGVVDLAGYAKQVPALNIIGAGGPGQGEIVLRGITTGNDQSSSVGMYLDDVPFTPSSPIALATSFPFDPTLMDIERVEILEGPQSTLYGANTVGGVIKLVTKQPDLEHFDATVRVDGDAVDGGNAGYGVRGSFNIPVIPGTVALRASVFYRDDPGFIQNDFTGARDVNWDIVRGGRIAVKVQFNDAIQTTATGFVQDTYQAEPNNVFLNPATLRPSQGSLAYSSPISQPTTTNYRSASDLLSATVPFMTITNILSYSQLKFYQFLDVSFEAQYFGAPSNPPAAGNENTTDSRRVTDELRLTSNPGRVEWLLGAFYTLENDPNFETVRGADASGMIVPPTSPVYNGYTAYFYPHFREIAGYGDLTYHFNNQWQATVGTRYSSNSQTVHWNSNGLFGTNDVPPVAIDDSSSTYLATVSYKPVEALTAYLRAASGYRPGGPNVLLPGQAEMGAPTGYRSDHLWNYEAGIKGTLSPQVSYTADVYHMLWKHLQIEEQINIFDVVANVGDATSDGVEATLNFVPLERLDVALKGAYDLARFTSYTNAQLGAVAGEPLPYAPHVSLASVIDYRFADTQGFVPKVGATFSYRSREIGAYNSGATLGIPAFESLDLRAGMDWSHYTLLAKVDNATNRYGLSSVGYGTYLNSPLVGIVMKPRTFGLAFQAHF